MSGNDVSQNECHMRLGKTKEHQHAATSDHTCTWQYYNSISMQLYTSSTLLHDATTDKLLYAHDWSEGTQVVKKVMYCITMLSSG